uniref:Uncharacterized protein n=1 Tax=Ursus maritimus TaxID=29073 RepID=A0A452T8C7_URSMA
MPSFLSLSFSWAGSPLRASFVRLCSLNTQLRAWHIADARSICFPSFWNDRPSFYIVPFLFLLCVLSSAPCAYLSPWLLHSLFPAFHHLPNGEAGRSPPQAGIHLPSLTLLQAIKLRLQDRGGEKNENSAERAVEGKWDSFRTGPIDKSGQEEMASSSEKWRAPQTARPGERTSSRGCAQEEARLGGALCRRLGSVGNRPRLPRLNEKLCSSPHPPRVLSSPSIAGVRKPAAQPDYRFRILASAALSAAIRSFLSRWRPGTHCRALFYSCCSLCSHPHPVLRRDDLAGLVGLVHWADVTSCAHLLAAPSFLLPSAVGERFPPWKHHPLPNPRPRET